MDPHLQLMVGPLLRYDTVDESGIWHGAALIVTADSGSNYGPHPTLTYQWDPDGPALHRKRHVGSFELGPHPADPHMTAISSIYVHAGGGGTFTFWRFLIQIPLGPNEMCIQYAINQGIQLEFVVPARNQNMRWAAHSCNGFSSGVNPDDFRGPGFRSGYDPVWSDLLQKHNEEPFHVLVGGGDQLYCDSLTREPELQEWVTQTTPEAKKDYPLTQDIAACIDRFYFNHYCSSFRSGAFARANSSIPMLNMCGMIDGFGSYPDDVQLAPVFKAIGSRGYFFFLLFQCFINPQVDGLSGHPGEHPFKSLIIGAPGPFVSSPSHSVLSYLGPNVYMLLLDCRAERKKDQVCSPYEYRKVFEQVGRLPAHIEHLVVQIGIPIAYPRLVFLESALGWKFNPLVALGRSGMMGLGGFVNKFNAEAELLDDLASNDHWTAKGHKKERNWFIQQLQGLARVRRIRVTFLSGDVHCAAVGVLKTLARGNGKAGKAEIPPATDFRYMLNVVTSAIVNTPPPNGVITMVSTLATKVHKTLHHADTDESMIPLFEMEPDGSSRKQKFVMGRRNWCSVHWDNRTGDLVFDIRVEKQKGYGVTVGYVQVASRVRLLLGIYIMLPRYAVRAPPPQWIAGSS
ncbi:hypothetical protein SERLADRAFT_351219 [Serpula lacrymans var. lacrymans S7.9]|uniref:PhoD-like phosphatase domain-containing protein n=1 Tax=Serpula lacrymans var. lacrymans (strain S7.9) TaxID=578457 RepID=F8P6C1_SERL9|nr:uncharacterized protein SERLADRAFT_351219 [Serpula lacrymans var. lacrymans S7.9]EGO20988.1 hypothetical protein SERLADRAFT_351219 [Serpula lacrymans var. lacrymans S7.9]